MSPTILPPPSFSSTPISSCRVAKFAAGRHGQLPTRHFELPNPGTSLVRRTSQVRTHGRADQTFETSEAPYELLSFTARRANQNMISIREELPEDIERIRSVTTQAFANSEYGHNGEAELIDNLRSNCNETLSMVAVDNGEVVGHILFSPVSIHVADRTLEGMGLGPMSVATDRQRIGIGTQLVESGLSRLAKADVPFVVVLGHRDYYPRFGFVPASHYRIAHGFPGLPQDAFFINMLKEYTLQSLANGTAWYRDEFGCQEIQTTTN